MQKHIKTPLFPEILSSKFYIDDDLKRRYRSPNATKSAYLKLKKGKVSLVITNLTSCISNFY